MKVVSTHEEATRLAELLNGHERERPVVVVSTPSGRGEPWIDAAAVEGELGDLAEVYLIPTGPHSRAFSEKMPAGTQVYGGAGRAYPLGHDWVGDLKQSPLRFAYDASDGARATELLIDDALGMAAAAGLFEAEKKLARVQRIGVVKGIVADRALIEHNGHLAYVAPALAFHGLPIERVLAKGMQVSGWWDPNANWFDVRESRRDPVEALADYQVGDLVLALVREVGEDSASLFIHPLVEVVVEREDVTSNGRDKLLDLMSPGEVLAARVRVSGPAWRLSLIDVDDDEEPRPSIALFEGGPPWLVPPVIEEPAEEVLPVPSALGAAEPAEQALAVEEFLAAIEASLAEVAPTVQPAEPASRRGPSPLLLDPQRRHLASQVPASVPRTEPAARGVAVETMGLTITKLQSQIARLREELDPMRARLSGLEQENAGLAAEVAGLRRRNTHQETLLQHARARLRRAGQSRPSPVELPEFADREEGFRYAVLTAWARRTPRSEQATRPLPDYTFGRHFLDSLAALEGISTEKVADVVFEILTDRAKNLDGRELHPLRAGEAGNSPQRMREDGATAWRAALQRHAAAARRIHFWRLPGGGVELWHVGPHDEVPTG
jgi:hypothetical protein